MLRITYWPEPTDNRPRIGREKRSGLVGLMPSLKPEEKDTTSTKENNLDSQSMSRLRHRPTSSKRRLPVLPLLRMVEVWIEKRLGNSSPR